MQSDMSNSGDSSNPIAKSLKKFAEEVDQRCSPSNPSDVNVGKITGSQSFTGKVDPGRYGTIGDKKK